MAATSNDVQQKYWFPAKRYGWGWGLPTAWQGWVVFGVFFVFVGAGAVVLLPHYNPVVFVAYSVFLCIVLVGICWLKGEPPSWRWGDK
jgi:hypothetical protein